MSEFDNINGIYAKDVTLREGIATLRNTVTSQTIKPLTVTQNGTYTADPSEGTYGYSPVTVDVQEQPWQPLEDGYSNFWFELTNDTLSPWLNFSAKTEDAVIDWGDGSGEVALDTLTPTHTYAKAGKYVVKVKGVTGIAEFNPSPYNNAYFPVVVAAELNNEVLIVRQRAFRYCRNLQNISATSVTSFELAAFYGCTSLVQMVFPSSTTTIGTNSFSNALYLEDVYVDKNVTVMGQSVFRNTLNLKTVHMKATTPPSLGEGSFSGSSEGYIIYVPVGTLSAYQTAWSTYADHILEEGQTPNRMMLAKFNGDNTDTEEMR